jgi:hypothetical protein
VKYALLIYNDQLQWNESSSPEDVREGYKAYQKFEKDHASQIVVSHGLQPTTTATTVRIQGGAGGDVVTTDGPYVETKEQLAGFFVIEAADLDEAIQIAARIPSAAFGGVEVRPLWGES